MGRFLRLYRETVGTILDTKDLIYFLLGVFGIGGGVTTIVLLRDIPIIWPIGATIIAGLLIIYSFIKMLLSYKRWHSFKGDALLDQVMQKLADMHIQLNKVAVEIVASNRKKNIETKERERIGRDLFRAMGFTDKVLLECLNADKTGVDEKKLEKKAIKYFKIHKNQYFTVLPMLETISRALNRANLGLKGIRQNDEYYTQMNNDLILLQMKLNVPNDKMAELNNLKDLSYGLINLSIGMQLVNENRSWYDRTPNYIKDRVEDVFKLNDIYTEASSFVKRNIKKAMLADSMYKD